MRRITAFLAAAGMAAAPVAATAQDASALSLAGASVPMSSGLSFLQGEEGGGGSTAVALGVLLIVLIGAAAISGNGDHPHSP